MHTYYTFFYTIKHFTLKQMKKIHQVSTICKGTVIACLRLTQILLLLCWNYFHCGQRLTVTNLKKHFHSLFSLTSQQHSTLLLTILFPWTSVSLWLSWNHGLPAIPSQLLSEWLVSHHLTIKCWSFSRFIPRTLFFHTLFSLSRHSHPCPWLQLPAVYQRLRSPAQTSPLSSRLRYPII